MASGFPDNRPVFLRGQGGRFAADNFGFYWQGLEVLSSGIQQYARKLHTSRAKAGKKIAADMEKYAKANHPWRNRTTDAERGLKGVAVETSADVTTISLGHSVRYGPKLENTGYAIIQPTLLLFQPLWAGYIKEALDSSELEEDF